MDNSRLPVPTAAERTTGRNYNGPGQHAEPGMAELRRDIKGISWRSAAS